MTDPATVAAAAERVGQVNAGRPLALIYPALAIREHYDRDCHVLADAYLATLAAGPVVNVPAEVEQAANCQVCDDPDCKTDACTMARFILKLVGAKR